MTVKVKTINKVKKMNSVQFAFDQIPVPYRPINPANPYVPFNPVRPNPRPPQPI